MSWDGRTVVEEYFRDDCRSSGTVRREKRGLGAFSGLGAAVNLGQGHVVGPHGHSGAATYEY
jgi:hypothetical protein